MWHAGGVWPCTCPPPTPLTFAGKLVSEDGDESLGASYVQMRLQAQSWIELASHRMRLQAGRSGAQGAAGGQ